MIYGHQRRAGAPGPAAVAIPPPPPAARHTVNAVQRQQRREALLAYTTELLTRCGVNSSLILIRARIPSGWI